jgi:hypothetical protein
MASAEIKIQFENRSDREIYEGAILAVPQAGLKIWKTREIARLVLARGEVNGQEVQCNIMVSMVDKSVTLSAGSDDLDEDALKTVLVHLEETLKAQLA